MFGDEVDVRLEVGREEREAVARTVCTTCRIRFACLEYALVNNEQFGVWGGMTQGERRVFRQYLRRQGYKDIPTREELRGNVNVWEGSSDGLGPVLAGDGARSVAERHGRPPCASPDEAARRTA